MVTFHIKYSLSLKTIHSETNTRNIHKSARADNLNFHHISLATYSPLNHGPKIKGLHTTSRQLKGLYGPKSVSKTCE